MRNRLKTGIAGVAFLLLSMLPASAAMTPWSTSEGGRMRLVALPDASTPGKVIALLDIEPNAGWKTYWRDPGDAGMAPSLDFSQSQNLKLVNVLYPTPEIGKDEGGRFVGYHQPVSLVLEFEKPAPEKPAILEGNVLVGICKDICLPFQASYELRVDANQTEPDAFMRTQMAMAAVPEAPSSDFSVDRAALSADKSTFDAVVTVPGGDLPEIAAAPSEGLLLGKEVEVMGSNGKVSVRYKIARMPPAGKPATIRLLVKSAGRAIETELAVK